MRGLEKNCTQWRRHPDKVNAASANPVTHYPLQLDPGGPELKLIATAKKQQAPREQHQKTTAREAYANREQPSSHLAARRQGAARSTS